MIKKESKTKTTTISSTDMVEFNLDIFYLYSDNRMITTNFHSQQLSLE